jgi:hypothetical protein
LAAVAELARRRPAPSIPAAAPGTFPDQLSEFISDEREDAGTAALAGYGLRPADVLAADQQLTTRALALRYAGLSGSIEELRARAYLDALLGRDSAPAQPIAPRCTVPTAYRPRARIAVTPVRTGPAPTRIGPDPSISVT